MSVPKEVKQAFTTIVKLTDAFCEKHLNNDYRHFCEEMAIELCEAGLPINKGKPAGWASGIVHALGLINFLYDPKQSPHMTSAQVAEGFSVSQATMLAKSRIIRDELDLVQLDPDWCLPALLAENPLVWMFDVGGFIMDIRMAPSEVQEEAYRLGLIPFVPAHEQEPGPESGTGPKIIEFPSKRSDNSRLKSPQKMENNGPKLFNGLEE